LNVLKWLRENGCPWSVHALQKAKERKNPQTLKWLIENGCPEN